MAGPVIYQLSEKCINSGNTHHLDLMEFRVSHRSSSTFRQKHSQKWVFYIYFGQSVQMTVISKEEVEHVNK